MVMFRMHQQMVVRRDRRTFGLIATQIYYGVPRGKGKMRKKVGPEDWYPDPFDERKPVKRMSGNELAANFAKFAHHIEAKGLGTVTDG